MNSQAMAGVRGLKRAVFGALLALILLAPTAALGQADEPEAPTPVFDRDAYRLTLLHFGNVGDSLLADDEGLGIAPFVTAARREYRQADRDGAVALVATGDYLTEGRELAASLQSPDTDFMAQALSRLPVDAYAVGDADFDHGPDVFADFVGAFNRRPVVGPFISANLDGGADEAVGDLVDTGRLARSMVVDADERRVALVSVIAPEAANTSSLGAATIDAEVAQAAQREVDAAAAAGVDIVVVVAHAGSADADRALIEQLSGVDVLISGSEPDPEVSVDLLLDADDRVVVLAAAQGGFHELGRIVLVVDDDGAIIGIETATPVVIDDTVRPDLWTGRLTDQLGLEVARFATRPVVRTQVDLNGVRSDLRSGETNLGNLVADALLWRSAAYAERVGLPTPDIALVASELLTGDAVYESPRLTMRDTFDIAGSAGNVVIVEAIDREQLQAVLEDAVATMDNVSGRSPQFAGFTLDLDLLAPAREADLFGVTEPGARVVNLTLADGTEIIRDGEVIAGEPLSVATVDRLVVGEGRYQIKTTEARPAGGSLRQAVVDYLETELQGAVAIERYPEGGDGRLFIF